MEPFVSIVHIGSSGWEAAAAVENSQQEDIPGSKGV